MRTLAVLVAMVLASGCTEVEQLSKQVLGTPAGTDGCEQSNDIVSVALIANNPNYVIYEVDYCYDGSFGEDVRINMAPAQKDNFVPHAPVQALAGRNQVTLTLVAQNFIDDSDTKSISHLEISMDLLISGEPGDESRKLLSEVVNLSAILHGKVMPDVTPVGEATASK